MRAILATISALIPAAGLAGGWEKTKDIADDLIYHGNVNTFYCGCGYQSHGDHDGSGDITDVTVCGFAGPAVHAHRAGRVEWEHIVPASLMPARQFECWTGEGGSRRRCEETDPRAQAMIFDLYNLAPSIGQVNALRSNDRYGELPDDADGFGHCPAKDSRGLFEPPDCNKGDVARTWLYMELRYGLAMPPDEKAMFVRWAGLDPVSPWESEREARISDYSRIVNPFVRGAIPEATGACPWEPE